MKNPVVSMEKQEDFLFDLENKIHNGKTSGIGEIL